MPSELSFGPSLVQEIRLTDDVMGVALSAKMQAADATMQAAFSALRDRVACGRSLTDDELARLDEAIALAVSDVAPSQEKPSASWCEAWAGLYAALPDDESSKFAQSGPGALWPLDLSVGR